MTVFTKESSPLSVSAFLARINELLETQVAWVQGEVSEYRVTDGKWVHFDLKDQTSLVHCFGLAFRLRTPLEDGMTVRLWGIPRVYPRYGKFSLVVERVEPVGEGALRRAFELLRLRLEREGLFAPSRKRALPRIPERIALLTSPAAAAYADFLTVLRQRRGGITILFLPVPVQGEGALDAIARAVDWVSEEHPALDALVLVRGGGSLADLHAFNDEGVVRAVARSRVPTLVGVGHERDRTLVDLVADVRASTPSNAAELLTPTRGELQRELQDLSARLVRAVRGRVAFQETRTARAVTLLSERIRAPLERLALLRRNLEQRGAALHLRSRSLQETAETLATRLRARTARLLEQTHARLGSLERLLGSIHPRALLRRGYSITRGPAGRVLRRAAEVRAGDLLTTTLHEGAVDSTVTSGLP